jgi:RimJ/RimL family protein N-acetyltransferase
MRDEADGMIVHLLAMWVDPKVRGGGAAGSLVRALITWANSLGAQRVELKVILGNDRARRFYERMGFQVTGRQEIRERDGRIEVQMERPT